MTEIQWSEEGPPPDGRSMRNRNWSVIVADLKTRPGVWAKFPDSARSAATHLKRSFPGIETTCRVAEGDRPSRATLWVRWVGES